MEKRCLSIIIPIWNGEDNYCHKLTNISVFEIIDLYKTGDYSQRELGRMYGVDHAAIGRVVHKKSWKHLHKNKIND